MILPDVNVLLYAFRSDSVDHARYKKWLEDILNSKSAYGISPQVLAAVVQISTHPRIFARPSRLEDAFSFSAAMLAQSHATIIIPGERHWTIFEDLCRRAAAIGNLIQDAWYAALAIEAGCEWITTDRDFARFEGLNWRTPW